MEDFTISEVAAVGGALAIAPLVGRSGAYAGDLAVLLAWRPDLVVSLTRRAASARLGGDLGAAGVAWRHFPITDFATPEPAAPWGALSVQARSVLAGGGRVLVHCAGGCGRSGMVALRLMIEAGEAPEAALGRLRAVRPCAVETEAQRRWAFAGQLG